MRNVSRNSAQVRPVPAEIAAPGPWMRRLRRVRSRPLGDPLSQSVLALTSSLVSAGLGLSLLATGSQVAAAAVLCLAAVAVAAYTALAVRALKRDKAVRYWQDCRDLRLEVTRRDAHLRLRWDMLAMVHDLDRVGADRGGTQTALAALVKGAYGVFDATRSDDIAVVVALEANGRYRILHAAASRRSRWTALSPGKHCSAEGPIEETLTRLARHHRALGIETRHGRLRMVVLSDACFSDADHEFCDELPLYLLLIAKRWAPVRDPATVNLTVVS